MLSFIPQVIFIIQQLLILFIISIILLLAFFLAQQLLVPISISIPLQLILISLVRVSLTLKFLPISYLGGFFLQHLLSPLIERVQPISILHLNHGHES